MQKQNIMILKQNVNEKSRFASTVVEHEFKYILYFTPFTAFVVDQLSKHVLSCLYVSYVQLS